jgi:hypothetical protein
MKRTLLIVALALAAASSFAQDLPRALSPEQLEGELAQRQQATAESNAASAGVQSGVNTGLAWTQYGIGVVSSLQELQNAYQGLHGTDATCMDLSAAGAPSMPSNCAGNNSACGQCYSQAYRELNGMRVNLERLRCTYRAYKRYVDAAVAFGDNASGIHAVTGLAWQNERGGIMQEMDKLNQTYDAKYQAMMPNLQQALQKVGACEAQFYNERDWYNRFGFIYYTFMSDRYKR